MDDDHQIYEFTLNKDLNEIIFEIFIEKRFGFELKIQAL